MKKPRQLAVGPNHRRGIWATLTLLDQAVCEFEQWAEGREIQSVLCVEENPLTGAQRQDLLARIAEVRELLEEARATLGLHETRVSASQAIWARCSSLREHILELHGKHLQRYGEVPPALARYADGLARRLLECLDRIAAVTTRGSAPTEDP